MPVSSQATFIGTLQNLQYEIAVTSCAQAGIPILNNNIHNILKHELVTNVIIATTEIVQI